MLVFLTLVGAALLALIVVVIYLNDRVNELERRTATGGAGGGGGGGGGGHADDNSWHGLTGKRLWDAMAGKKGVTPLDEAALAALRTTYEDVLARHIESLYRAGQADARRGASVQPTAVKTLGSARGSVQSWIPLNHANALYRAGVDSTKNDIFEAERARVTLDEVAQVLYAQTGLSLTQPFSDLILGPEGGGPAGDATGDSAGSFTASAADPTATTAQLSSPAALPAIGSGGTGTGATTSAPGLFGASTGVSTGASTGTANPAPPGVPPPSRP